ncbi:sphingomyelin phosphodiesterase-like [Stegodyphus dumicola]|nr:sphingomyelin phosphodiesterase-like [Stegodyphus dumicola]
MAWKWTALVALCILLVSGVVSQIEDVGENEVEEPSKEEGKFFPKLLSHIFDILSFRKVVAELKVGKTSPTMCFVCKFGIALLQHFVETDKPQEEIAHIAYTICSTLKLDSDRVCAGIINLFKDEIMYVFQRTTLGPQEVCGVLLGNDCARITSPLHNWTVPLTPFPKPPPEEIKEPKAGAPVYRVLHLSDTHLDPYYLEGSNADCKELMCCRIADGPAPTPAQAAGKWGDYRNCDTPLRTLEHMLRHITSRHKIDYVLWTGDIPPHDVWNTTRPEQVRLLHYVSRILQRHLPGIPVYPALGNHESARINSFPQPEVKGRFSIQWLHEEVTKAWGHWLPPEALRTLRKGMYYAVRINPGLRLLSLNMNYCNSQNWWMLLNSTDPGQELEWLVQQLQEAELRGEKVHIIGHIPPGHSDCLPVWSANYNRIINRFENTVRGQFFGHSHLDELEIFYDGHRPTSVAYIGPSVTSYDGVNPSYRIYTVDGNYPESTQAVLDHETYYLNLTEANMLDKPKWRKSYSARKEYGLTSLQPDQWNKLLERFQEDDKLFQKFVSHLYHLSDFPREDCTGECKQETLCRMRTARSHDSSFCN